MGLKVRMLQNTVFLLAVAVSLVAGCGSVHWEHNYQKGVTRAAQLRKRSLIQFYSPLDADCLAMDREVFSNPDVQKALNEFVAIRLDYMLNKRLADDLNVQVLPSFFVLRPDGRIMGSYSGRMDEQKFRIFLLKQRYK